MTLSHFWSEEVPTDHEQGCVLVPGLWAEGGTAGAEVTKKVQKPFGSALHVCLDFPPLENTDALFASLSCSLVKSQNTSFSADANVSVSVVVSSTDRGRVLSVDPQ